MKEPVLKPIGVVHCDINSRKEAPQNYTRSNVIGTLEIYPEYHQGLDGISPGQTLVVLFWLHHAERGTLKVYPRGDRSRGLHGVFSTRSPMRPNPIAVSELKLLSIHRNMLEVSGLDIIDGTPIVDIKKKID